MQPEIITSTSKIALHNEEVAFDDPLSRLCDHTFSFFNPYFDKTILVSFTYHGKILVAGLLAFVGFFVILGVSLDSFQFDFEGAVGLVLKFLKVNPITGYSVLSLGWELPTSSADPNNISIRWIQVCFFLFVFIIPISHVILLICLWLIPMKMKSQQIAFATAEVLNAWAALEVFVVAIVFYSVVLIF